MTLIAQGLILTVTPTVQRIHDDDELEMTLRKVCCFCFRIIAPSVRWLKNCSRLCCLDITVFLLNRPPHGQLSLKSARNVQQSVNLFPVFLNQWPAIPTGLFYAGWQVMRLNNQVRWLCVWCGVPISIRISVCNRRYVNASVKWWSGVKCCTGKRGEIPTALSVNRSTNHHSVGALISKWFFHNVARSQHNIPRNKTSAISTPDTRTHTHVNIA